MRALKHVFLAGACLASTLATSSCKPKETSRYAPEYGDARSAERVEYIFGVHPLHNPQHLFAAFGPMVDYLNRHLTGAQIRLEASRDYAAFEQKLYSGHFNLALPNPYEVLTSTRHGYHIFGKVGDDQDFRGILLLRKDSLLSSLDDLRGKAISYPAPTALAATMMTQWYLHIHGIDVATDIDNRYVGSQESSIMSAYLGTTAAASTWPPPWWAFMRENPEKAAELVVKWETPPLVNNGLVARDDVPAGVLESVSKLLFDLKTAPGGAQILAAMEVSDLEPADADTYRPVEQFLARFEKEVRPVGPGR